MRDSTRVVQCNCGSKVLPYFGILYRDGKVCVLWVPTIAMWLAGYLVLYDSLRRDVRTIGKVTFAGHGLGRSPNVPILRTFSTNVHT